MGTIRKDKWYVHCPVCGGYLIKSSVSNSEVTCRKCHNNIGVLVEEGVVTVFEKPGDENETELQQRRVSVYRQRLHECVTATKV